MTSASLSACARTAMVAAIALATPAPLLAQAATAASQAQLGQIDKRVNTLERQMRAVQREVFPGGDKRFFAPEVAPEPATPATLPGAPAGNPLVDLNQRVSALEEQQRTLTGQIEQLQFQLRQMQAEWTKARQDSEFRLNALESGGTTPAPTGGTSAPTSLAPAESPPPAVAPATASPSAPPMPAARPTAEVGEAAYRAGFALYQAGNDAGAQKAFADFLRDHPDHARTSHASFWTGRSQMRQNLPAPAAKTFLETYQKYPRGERAPNALLWLGKALTVMKRNEAACQALDELRKVYPDRLTGALLTEANAARADARCGA